MSWRLASRFSVISMALLVVVIVAVWGMRNTGGSTSANSGKSPLSGLQGTDLGSTVAPDFHLTDQFGKPIALSQFRGEPVVLTFLYAHCPDACPLTAEKLHTTQVQLGKDASHVMMLAVSVDPKGDTSAAVQNFSTQHKLTSNWHYLIGEQTELAPVWNSYSVDAQPATSTTSMHTSAVYVIDKMGRERVLFDSDFTPTQLQDDLKVLLAE
ncbi:MAG TPA: SCO family protein [Ktedonobacteraceae bacterium]|nr:SCO family protein [Ktedonobacteraceae bacterium]